MRRKLFPLFAIVAVGLGVMVAQAASATATTKVHKDWEGGGSCQMRVAGTISSIAAPNFTITVNQETPMVGENQGDNDGDGDDNGGAGSMHPMWDNGGFGCHAGFFGQGDQGGGLSGRGDRLRSHQMTSTNTTPTTTTTTTTPTPTTLTIATTTTTKFIVNGNSMATFSNLAVGQKVIVVLAPSMSTSTTTTTTTTTTPTTTTTTTSASGGWDGRNGSIRSHQTTTPSTTTPTALTVIATSPPQLYAFVGTLSAAPAAGATSLSVGSISASLPSGLFTAPATFTVGPNTLVFGGSAMTIGSLSGLASGDIVAGGVIGTAGETAAQVEATPLQVVVDFTTAPSSTMSATTLHRLKTEALNRAEKMLKAKMKKNSKAKSTKKAKPASRHHKAAAHHKAAHHTAKR